MGVLDKFAKLVGGGRVVVKLDEPPAAGNAGAAVKTLIAELRPTLASQIQKGSTDEVLEAVLTRDQLESCEEILEPVLGEPAKPFGQSPAFDKALITLVDSRGGIRKDQCLYLCRYEDDFVAFAALWPWSGGDNITLRVGVYEEPYPA
ncbi:MAG: hypothetical protein V3T77_02080 [Planctomycetota bacterium]